MESGLKPELERFLEEQVAAGRYASRDEAMNAAVALLREQAEYRAYVQSAIAEAEASLARGEGTVYDAEGLRQMAQEIKAEGRERLARREVRAA